MTNSCPQCNSKAFKKNGYTRHGKQNHRCLDCGKQFSLEPTEVYSSAVDHFSNTIHANINQLETVTS